VKHQQLKFKYARGTFVRHGDQHVGLDQRLAPDRATRAGDQHHRHVLAVRGADCRQRGADVGAGGIEQQQHVAGLAERLQLLGVDLLGAGAVGQGGARGQGQRGQARPLALEATDEDIGEVARQRRCGATPAAHDLAAGGDRPEQRTGRFGHRPRQRLGRLVLEIRAVEKLLLDALFEHVHGSYDTARARPVPWPCVTWRIGLQ
jgi:hypothetical protein